MPDVREGSSHYLNQVCSIAACGAFGLVIVLAHFQGLLELIVPNWFVPYVLASGFAIFGLVVIQAFLLLQNFVHHRDYGKNYNMKLWRHAVLCLPTILYLSGLPSQAFTSRNALVINEPGDGSIQISIEDLQIYANDDVLREKTAGVMVRVKGQFAPGKLKMTFGLVHLRPNRQGFEPIPSLTVISEKVIPDFQSMTWVQATGEIQFRKHKSRDEYFPVLKLRSSDDIVVTQRPSN